MVFGPSGLSPTSSADRYTYLAQPVVTSVSPPTGCSTGGAHITVIGTGLTDVVSVKFGAVSSPGFTENAQGTIISATTPKHRVGTADITVRTPGGKSLAVVGDRYSWIRCH